MRRLRAASDAFPARDGPLRVVLAEVLSRVLPAPAVHPAAPGVKENPAPPAWLKALCDALQRPEHAQAGVTSLPGVAHKSAEHLARSFRKYLGLTPTDFINARRLDRAANLLATGEEKILALAYDCGFEQPGYFYRLFHRRFGVTPLQYRRRSRQVVDPVEA